MYTSSYFTARQRRSTKTLSSARPRPSLLTATPADSRRPVNASAVNCAPLGAGRGHLGAVGEDRFRPGEQLFLPGADLCRVDVVLTGQLDDRPVCFLGGQGDLGLEPRGMNLPLDPIGSPPPGRGSI